MIAVTLPQLSISMEDGKVARWLVADGDTVAAGQSIVEIETDKATMELEAPADGVICILAGEGAVLAVEGTLAEIRDGDAVSESPSDGRGDRGRQIVSPAARRIASERGVDLARVDGSGPGGRIVARDVPVATPERSSLREAVVANVVASWQEIPHIHIGGELDGTGLAEAKRNAAQVSVDRPTVSDLLILALVPALLDVPELNGALGRPSDRVHLALAVATSAGVVAPVLRDAHELSPSEVTRERARLVAAAREGRSDPRDLAGGTFTLSNLGAYPVDFFAPVVSGPQIAMLATGRLAAKPVAVDGMLAVRHRLWANIAIDHRGADGETGGRFLRAFEQRLQELPNLI